MPKKKGQKKKLNNDEKQDDSKQQEATLEPPVTNLGDFAIPELTAKELNMKKRNEKDNGRNENISQKSNQAKPVIMQFSQSCSETKTSTSAMSDDHIEKSTPSTIKSSAKETKKKGQKEPANKGNRQLKKSEDAKCGTSNKVVYSNTVIKRKPKKEEQKSNRTEESAMIYTPEESHTLQEENDRKETKICATTVITDEMDFESLEFTTQQSRKKRNQKKGHIVNLLKEESPTQQQQVLKPNSEPPRDQQPTRKKKILADEHQQLQTNENDVKRVFPPVIEQKLLITGVEKSESSELSIPYQKTRSGTKGRPILIETNHLALRFQKLDRAIHYDVTITPSTPKKLLRKVMEEFRQTYYGNRYPSFDGMKNLYSSTELPFGQQTVRDVTLFENERPRTYQVVIKFANYVDLTPLKKFMTANPKGIHHMVTPQEVIQCLDVVLRSSPALTCLPVGHSFFTPPRDQVVHLGGGMEMYCGFYQSAIIGWKPFLNIDVAHKAFPMCQNVVHLISELCDLKLEDLQYSLGRLQQDTVARFITTLKIRYEIPNKLGTKREYRVNGLGKPASEAVFKPEGGPEITVEKYFFKEKNITLKYPHMPCLWVGNKERTPRILLPVEFCVVIEGQVTNCKMLEKVTSAMIKRTGTSTKVRKEKIMESVQQVQFNRDPCVSEFGITVDEQFTKINARVLDPPTLTYSGRSVVKPIQGVWKPTKFLSGATLTQWTVIITDGNLKAASIEEMIKLICSQATNLGMSVAQPQRPFVTLQPHYKKELKELVALFTAKKNLQLLLVIVPNVGQFYSYVKQAAELTVGCLTQCIRSCTVSKLNVSVVINLLQKINAKLEGINHVLNDRMDWMRRPYMIMGADVTHPSRDAHDKPSVAAVTASYDVGAFKYNFCWRLQPAKVEIIEDLENITREQLLYFYKKTKFKPERIVFFRDGVSEGQFSCVLNTEIQAIRRACICLQPDGTYKPKITFLVVQKRHHTRFFPLNEQDASKDGNLNVPVGTCVDTEITHPAALDFCLVSHASIRGVARPTKYRILWDDADMTEDELQQLSFYLCHMFSRCTRSVSYPAPTYYAHLAAARIMAYCETSKLNMNNLPQEQKQLCIKEFIAKERPMFFV